MKKAWIFFKLRLLQLKSDKTALFFSYILPVLLLLGIGYPLEKEGNTNVDLYYSDEVNNDTSKALIEYIEKHPLLNLKLYDDSQKSIQEAIESNEVKHFLRIVPIESSNTTSKYDKDTQKIVKGGIEYQLDRNTIKENNIENAAILGVLNEYFYPDLPSMVSEHEVKSDRYTSYIVILLPGLIGMTLLVIGLNGFGGVLIEEQHHGLFKNIKTIDVSPIPFLAGLFVSRLLVSYSVAIALFLVGVFVFNITMDVNYVLLGLVVTLGCLAFLGVGLMLSAISPSVNAFNGIVNFVQLPFIMLGGVFFSISVFPDWLQIIAKTIPLTQMNSAMQKVMFESVGFHEISNISPEIAILTTWCVFTLFIAHKRFSW